jgi:hypothetical protein
MAKRYLVFVTAEQVSSHRWQDDRLVSERFYPVTDEGRAEFDRFLQRQGSQPVCLLTDLVEEDYRFETVPHLSGGDRGALFERKLEQYYRSTPYRHAEIQGRDKEGRRDDRAVFSALTNPPLLSPWVEMMVRNAVPLQGIFSVPLVSRALLAGMSASHILLLSWQKHAGLRQTYFIESNLRFTRLTAGVEEHNLVERVVGESSLTIKYLASLSLLPSDHPLDVCVVCDAATRRELEARLRTGPDTRFHYLDTRDLPGKVGYKGPLEGADATPLLLHSLAKSPPPNQYGNAGHTHFYSLWRLRRGLQAAAAAVLVASAGWSLVNLWQAYALNLRADNLAEESRKLESTYRSLTADFPKTTTNTHNMKLAVATIEKLSAYSPPAEAVLDLVSRALEKFPNIQINKLSWESSFSPDSAGGGTGGAAAAAPPPPSPQDLPAEVILLDAEIWPFNNDYRKALDTVEEFRKTLTDDLGLEVKVVTLPLDLRPEATLSGGAEQSGVRRAPFSLRMVWRRKA